jgi:hypothetical protein
VEKNPLRRQSACEQEILRRVKVVNSKTAKCG